MLPAWSLRPIRNLSCSPKPVGTSPVVNVIRWSVKAPAAPIACSCALPFAPPAIVLVATVCVPENIVIW